MAQRDLDDDKYRSMMLGTDEIIQGRVTYVNADVVSDALLSKTSFRNTDIS